MVGVFMLVSSGFIAFPCGAPAPQDLHHKETP
jgi:hypothetical protein